MKTKGIAIGVLAFTLFAFAAPQRAQAQVKLEPAQLVELQRKLVDSKIKIGKEYKYSWIWIVAVSGNALGGDPAVIGPVIQRSKSKPELNDKRRHPNFGKSGDGEQVLATVKSINPTSAASGRSVWIVVWHDPNLWTLSFTEEARLLVIQPDSNIDFHPEKDEFTLTKGSIKECKDFKATAELDDMMEFYSMVANNDSYYGMTRTVDMLRKKSTVTMHKDTKKANDALAAEVITHYSKLSASFGALSGAAPVWAMPLAFGDKLMQYCLHSQMAYALAIVYGKKPKNDEDFKYDLYLLFSGDADSIFRKIADGVGVADDVADAGEYVVKGAKWLSKTKVIEKCGGLNKFAAKVTQSSSAKVTSKIASKSSKVIPILSIVVGGSINAGEAVAFGKEAAKYYSRLR